ncbi:AAR144Wp [Eremothecium gossypii ATCC 10895]|uniref:Glutathione hydrolase n=1 Tax=Eremothecium gossypii (strain ATCC 10895 / CBS 109.51 / FGSC 9923 / NRRL Y-1056) TaxID=284811 RepID=Q75ED1_EREGS|nr:AAR144Wp [Eremothecium gossypii ATCC 10895]AAS50510.1 AAR144Wp [Eremothecium gossypii ATCC 10895]AEY94797.1 FAAR144Wp [Eremothecium gossypii FDAG1]
MLWNSQVCQNGRASPWGFIRLICSVSLFSVLVREGAALYIQPQKARLNGGNTHNIDIGPLNRSATLTPAAYYRKVGVNGAISSDLELCNRMTVHDILLGIPGANAADAAVTMSLCIGMINFFNSGIGGGGFAVYTDGQDPERHLAFDFREMAPELAHKEMYASDPNASKIGGLAIAIPGELAGLYEMYEKRGSGVARWEELLRPVIELGFQGWAVGPALAASLQEYEAYFKAHLDDWSFVYNHKEGRVLRAGEWISRPELAKTLQNLAASGGVKPFYDAESDLVKTMVNKIQSAGGVLSESDFENYEVDVTRPLSLKIRSSWEYLPNNDLTVLTTSGSSSGAALLSALKILDQFPNKEDGDFQPEQAYQLIEAMKWMASARSRLGDFGGGEELAPQVRDVLGDAWTDYAVNLIKAGYIDGHFGTLVDWHDYLPEYELNDPHGTAHISIVDHFNNAVSLTTTVNLLFGSLVHDPSTGIVFNNEMDDFSQPGRPNAFGLQPSRYNFPEPFKRPLSSTCPTVVLNDVGLPDLVVGAAGGSRILTSVLQLIVRTYWYNMPLLEAVAYPRIHHQLLPEVLEVESLALLGPDTVDAIRRMGHSIVEVTPKSVVNAIRHWHGTWHAVSDYWRKRGISVAY